MKFLNRRLSRSLDERRIRETLISDDSLRGGCDERGNRLCEIDKAEKDFLSQSPAQILENGTEHRAKSIFV